MARKDKKGNEASLKYFVNGAFASAFLLFGMALIYGASGHLQIVQMRDLGSVGMLGLTLMLVGFGFKIGMVPFHFWVPDVYQGAPTSVTSFMSVTVKAAGFAVLWRFLDTVFEGGQDTWVLPLVVGSMLTMIVGNIMAVRQDSVKRMLAYSSVAHTGYALIGVISGAMSATVFYLFAYTFMTLGAFAFLEYIGRDGRDAESIEDFSGLAKRRPWAAAAMALFMISLGGIPPTAGFFGKVLLFSAGIRGGQYALVIVAALTSALSLFYYLRVVMHMYMREGTGEGEESSDLGTRAVIAITALVVLLLGVYPNGWLEQATRWIK